MESPHIGFEFEYRALRSGTQQWHRSNATTHSAIWRAACQFAILQGGHFYRVIKCTCRKVKKYEQDVRYYLWQQDQALDIISVRYIFESNKLLREALELGVWNLTGMALYLLEMSFILAVNLMKSNVHNNPECSSVAILSDSTAVLQNNTTEHDLGV